MDIHQIQVLAQQKESHTREFKKTTAQLRSAFETVCAFLNGEGGTILIGVNDSGHIIGQEVSDTTRQEIAKELSKIEPPAQIKIEYIIVGNNKSVITIQAPSGSHSPYFYDGRPFQRDQSVTRKMPQQRYDQLVSGRNQLNHSWEKFITTHYNLNLLDSNLILSAIRGAIQAKRLPEIALRQGIPQILESLQLYKDGHLNNAAITLFGTQFLPDYPQCQLKMARFKGTSRHEFLDSNLIYGNVFDLLENGLLFVKRHMPLAARIEPDKIERVETPLIPFNAIREALLNALCHRDYGVYGGSIGLAIYDDRMEIFNNGGLPQGVTLEKIKSGFSKPRNPLIAEIFYRCNLIEKWGRGIQEMISSCLAQGDPEPDFIVDDVEFKVLFRFPSSTKPEVISMQKTSQLTRRQKEILEILANADGLKVKEIISKLHDPPTQRTVRRDLATLKSSGKVGSSGHANTAIWFLIEKASRK